MIRKNWSLDDAPPLEEMLAREETKSEIDLLVQQESNECTCDQTNDDRKRYSGCRRGKGDPGNEDHGFQTFSKDSDEWKDEHAVFLAPSLECTTSSICCDGLLFEGFSKLDAPFLLHLRHTQKGSTENADNQSGE